jgi:hypothetical protein
MTIFQPFSITNRGTGYMQIYKRFWYKKGEYMLKRPHGISLNSFRSGDGWAWLSDHFEYIDQVKDQMYVLNLLEITFLGERLSERLPTPSSVKLLRDRSHLSRLFSRSFNDYLELVSNDDILPLICCMITD